MAFSKGKLARLVSFLEQRLSPYRDRLLTRFRSAYYRLVLGSSPPDFRVCGKIQIKRPKWVSVGQNVKFADGVYINAQAPVTIGNHVRLSAFVRINTRGLKVDVPPEERFTHTAAPVTIGDRVWIATGVTINAGVTIGDGVVVGAGAVVTRDLPPHTLCVGVPAKPIRDLPRSSSPEAPEEKPTHETDRT